MNQQFRSAINGFNREDVVAYLDFLSKQHISQMNQLNAEIDFLNKKLEEKEQPSAILEELTAWQDKCRELEAKVAELEAKQAEPQPVTQPKTPISEWAPKELEAYRRAEQVERAARERAEAVSRQTETTLSKISGQLDSTVNRVDEVSRQVVRQLDLLQEALLESRKALNALAEETK